VERAALGVEVGQFEAAKLGALRILEQYSGYRFSELTTIRRQKPAAFRQVVELAAAKQTDKAFAKLLELDADLLARRVTDSHTRKAAVELQALRDGLAKLGFIPKEQLKENAAPPAVEDFRVVRQRRPMRQTRLSPIQRLATAVEDVRRWLDERLGIEHKETVAENVGQTEAVKQAEAVQQTETVKPARTVREAMKHRQAHRQQQRRSGGIHV
jgi:hypothetical protein